MRRIWGAAVAAIALALVVAGCSASASTTRHTLAPDQGRIVGVWTVKRDFKTPEQPFVSFAQDNSWSASDGCDRVYGSWKVSSTGRLSVSESTHAALTCDGAMLPTAVAQGSHVRLSGDSLTLTSSDGSAKTTLQRTHASDVGPQGRPVGYWIGGRTPSSPYLSLLADGSYQAYDGCVVTTGTWTFSNTEQVRLEAASGAVGRCTGVDQWLTQATRGRVSADTMTLSDAAGKDVGTLDR
jgi:heat shock protein HslJ